MGVSRKQSTSNFPKNEHFLPPDMHMYVCVFVFFKHPFWELPFCLITDALMIEKANDALKKKKVRVSLHSVKS